MILAGDVGGTNLRLAAFEYDCNKLNCVVEKVYKAAEFHGLGEAVRQFTTSEGIPVDRACLGVAGPVRHGVAHLSNLDWTIDARQLAEQMRLHNVGLINDLEAFAYGINVLESKDMVTLQEGDPEAVGNAAVISAGTGLGEAGLYWDGYRHLPFPCEGGHADFGAGNEIELELHGYLLHKHDHVSWERVLSGPGIRNIYEFLRDTKTEEEPKWLADQLHEAADVPALISQLAAEDKAPICRRAMEIFVSIYGAEAGNCALKFMSLGGIYIGGSIAAKILPLMKKGAFIDAFLSKGRMRPLLEAMPVRIVLNDDAGILGAAQYTLVQKAFGRRS
jgi:glucokinase